MLRQDFENTVNDSLHCSRVPLMAAVLHNKTHHGMEHRIKSRHGLFKSYSGTDSVALEGTGQGSGASPAIWLIYMVSLLNAFKDFSPGMTITSPFEDLFVFILAILFMNDGMPRVNDALEDEALPLSDLLQTAQQLSQSWKAVVCIGRST